MPTAVRESLTERRDRGVREKADALRTLASTERLSLRYADRPQYLAALERMADDARMTLARRTA